MITHGTSSINMKAQGASMNELVESTYRTFSEFASWLHFMGRKTNELHSMAFRGTSVYVKLTNGNIHRFHLTGGE